MFAHEPEVLNEGRSLWQLDRHFARSRRGDAEGHQLDLLEARPAAPALDEGPPDLLDFTEDRCFDDEMGILLVAITRHHLRRYRTGRGTSMKFLCLEDRTDICEATRFDAAYRRYGHLTLTPGPYLLEGRAEDDEGNVTFNIDNLGLSRPHPTQS